MRDLRTAGGRVLEADAFTGFFDEHYAAVLQYGMRRVDAETARDVAAETFLVAWRRLDAVPDVPRVWLLAVARRVLANELRRQGRQDRLTERVGQSVHTLQTDQDHASAVAETSAVAGAMAALSDRDRELLQLIGWEGLDQRAAAQVLGCSVTALKVRLHRARRRLLTALEAQHDRLVPQTVRDM